MACASDHPCRLWRISKGIVLVLAMAGVVVVSMLWLLGKFHTRINPAGGNVVVPARPVGDARLAEAHFIQVPSAEWAVGTVRPLTEVSLGSKVMERVIEVNVHAGQVVKKNDVLVRLDDLTLRAQLERAKASLDSAKASAAQARIEADTTEAALKTGAATTLELDRAKAARATAEAEVNRAGQAVNEASTALNFTVITAPMDGVVIDKRVNVGDTVAPGQVLLVMYDRMQLIASVRESLRQRLKVEQPVEVHIDALGKSCQGTISEIVPEAQTASRTFAVKVVGPCQPDVFPGMFGRLKIPLDDEQVLVVPSRSVRQVGQMRVVEVAESGQLHRRAVQVGRAFGDDVEVLSGLRADETVRTDP